jgi:hypothetical protein
MTGVRGIGSGPGVPGDAGGPAPSTDPPGSSGQTVRPLNPRLVDAPRRVDGAGTGQRARFAASGAKPAPSRADDPTAATNIRSLAARRQEPMSSIVRRELTDVGNDAAALVERFGDLLTEIEGRSGRMESAIQRASAIATLAENLSMLPNIDGERPETNARFQAYLRLGNVVAEQGRETADPQQATDSERSAFSHAISAWEKAREHIKPGERAIIAVQELTTTDSTTDPAWVKETVSKILEAVQAPSDSMTMLSRRLRAVLTMAECLGSPHIAPAGSWPSFRDETLARLDGILRGEIQATANSEHREVIETIGKRLADIRTEIAQRVRTHGAQADKSTMDVR